MKLNQPARDLIGEGANSNDLVSKGFLASEALAVNLNSTLALADVNIDDYDGVHVVGGARVVVEDKLIAGQNRQSASEYAIAYIPSSAGRQSGPGGLIGSYRRPSANKHRRMERRGRDDDQHQHE
ncbi:MAG: hypothetical protein QOD88_775 [Mycobacterium sp.]|jgi:hypothetical protein|nr:hypothetical protein [Mycobacterium sp.]MDT5318253.1 hypothetical protein [Mycobacterium sp.]